MTTAFPIERNPTVTYSREAKPAGSINNCSYLPPYHLFVLLVAILFAWITKRLLLSLALKLLPHQTFQLFKQDQDIGLHQSIYEKIRIRTEFDSKILLIGSSRKIHVE